MYSKKTKTLTAAAVAVPLLMGLGQSAQAAQPATQESTAAVAAAAPLPTTNPCADVCTETGRVQVEHPSLGPVEVLSYERTTQPGTAPQGKQPAVAVYRDGAPILFASYPSDEVTVSYGPEPVIGDQVWDVAGSNPVDRYGNVYLSDSAGVTVLTPVPEGYNAHGTIPTSIGAPEFPFGSAGLTIDESGEATVHQKVLGADGVFTGETVD